MAKNTSSTTFRKIDVDQYNEDNYKEEEAYDVQLEIGPDEGVITQLINLRKNSEALKLLLSNAPLKSKNQKLKDNVLQLMLKVMLAIKPSQIEEIVNTLSSDQIDILMKYIYRGFQYPSGGNSAHLLLWHEKTFAVGGLGSIMRHLTDKYQV